jgi:hypothetical protein
MWRVSVLLTVHRTLQVTRHANSQGIFADVLASLSTIYLLVVRQNEIFWGDLSGWKIYNVRQEIR